MKKLDTISNRQAFWTGIITFVVIVSVSVIVFLLGGVKERKVQEDFFVARNAIAGAVSGRNCEVEITKARELIRQQLKYAKLRSGLINKRAVVYDLVLQQGQKKCAGSIIPDTPNETCDTVSVCRELAINAMLNGHYDQSKIFCERGLAVKESRAMRHLADLARDMKREHSRQ